MIIGHSEARIDSKRHSYWPQTIEDEEQQLTTWSSLAAASDNGIASCPEPPRHGSTKCRMLITAHARFVHSRKPTAVKTSRGQALVAVDISAVHRLSLNIQLITPDSEKH
ncbi:unnamed protein product [Soboliphyme baturini]|uniref:Uncharacterized protein n=1 Tax=Soboliphyme baturini TaxID=241478 RepID=A0A183IMT5_9BILA|nr:unnamed protein product [Soboliphyme baturini]